MYTPFKPILKSRKNDMVQVCTNLWSPHSNIGPTNCAICGRGYLIHWPMNDAGSIYAFTKQNHFHKSQTLRLHCSPSHCMRPKAKKKFSSCRRYMWSLMAADEAFIPWSAAITLSCVQWGGISELLKDTTLLCYIHAICVFFHRPAV